MPVRRPSARLARPNVLTLASGNTLERVHDRNFRADGFNPCQGAPTRFAPMHDARGNCVPSLYAADTLEAAIFETIFHDVPVTARRKTVPRTLVESRAHGRIELQRDLRLVSLRAPDLRRWRLSRNSLIASPPRFYEDTVRWAEAIHRQFPDVEGLPVDVEPVRSGHGVPVLRRPGERRGFQDRSGPRRHGGPVVPV